MLIGPHIELSWTQCSCVWQGCVEELQHGLTRLPAVSHDAAAQSRHSAAGQRRTTTVMARLGPIAGIRHAACSVDTHCVGAMCTGRDKPAFDANTTAITQLRRHEVIRPCCHAPIRTLTRAPVACTRTCSVRASNCATLRGELGRGTGQAGWLICSPAIHPGYVQCV